VFTGLVEEVGRIVERRPAKAGERLVLRAPLVREDLALGDSVSVNGACLTAVELLPDGFAVDAVAETLRRTSLGALADGDPVNLERAMRVGDRLGGHLVQGHVDATGTITDARGEGESVVLTLGAPPSVMRYIVEKGSVAVDGVSLTVAGRDADSFRVALIPHTMAHTTLGPGAVGRDVNLEVDLVAKYVEALVAPHIDRGVS
jgi:riboflavin synthase